MQMGNESVKDTARYYTDGSVTKSTREQRKDRIDMIRGKEKAKQTELITYISLTILLRDSGSSWARQSLPAAGAGAFGPTPAGGLDPCSGRQLASMVRIGEWCITG